MPTIDEFNQLRESWFLKLRAENKSKGSIATYGKGRTFYCSLGHRQEIYVNPMILRHYLAGIQFALGDLECDATPTAPTSGK